VSDTPAVSDMPAIYDEIVDWYRMLDPVENHEEEVADYVDWLTAAIEGEASTLLELGAGAGNNGRFFARRFRCTLTDLSEPMLALSRRLNPECEHAQGDMRNLRLGRSFDAVMVHDAISYMTTVEDLAAAILTAWSHTRPGGAALFTPDCVSDTFREAVQLHEHDEGGRSLRCLEWSFDPDPGDTSYCTIYSMLMRENGEVRAVHDRHHEGLFSRATWLQLLTEVGFRVEVVEREVEPPYTDQVYLCRRP
jgi:SAM-dependent methyltransferase